MSRRIEGPQSERAAPRGRTNPRKAQDTVVAERWPTLTRYQVVPLGSSESGTACEHTTEGDAPQWRDHGLHSGPGGGPPLLPPELFITIVVEFPDNVTFVPATNPFVCKEGPVPSITNEFPPFRNFQNVRFIDVLCSMNCINVLSLQFIK